MPRKYSSTILLLVAAGAAVSAPDRRTPPERRSNPLGRSAEVIAQGRQLYNSSCTVCHGLEGTVGDRAPALAATRRYLRTSDQDLFDAIKSGIQGTLMPPAGLPDNDVWKVVAYIRSLRATASDEFVEGDVKRGEEIFLGKGKCSGCHMIQGKGGLLGPDLSNTGAEHSLRFLRESLTKRREHIPKGYQPVHATTPDGRRIEGIVKNENNFSLQILDKSYNLHLFSRGELRDLVYEKESLMPNNYGQVLTAAEMQDLLAFLSRQARKRGPEERR